ncbi:hypothetical protein [Amycolatopsis sp. cmx-4-68]|uniref:hypothetical protein n=1 Tax=Amycolatopsis sp. cmx-4-68 TaxID=2790938 RepID=UPI00397BCBDC
MDRRETRAWSDGFRFTPDEILTDVTLYWLTETIGSSMRMYRANAAIPPAQLGRRVEVASGFALFPGDIVRPPRGGHFAAFEEPERYARELREFFRPYRAAAG